MGKNLYLNKWSRHTRTRTYRTFWFVDTCLCALPIKMVDKFLFLYQNDREAIERSGDKKQEKAKYTHCLYKRSIIIVYYYYHVVVVALGFRIWFVCFGNACVFFGPTFSVVVGVAAADIWLAFQIWLICKAEHSVDRNYIGTGAHFRHPLALNEENRRASGERMV